MKTDRSASRTVYGTPLEVVGRVNRAGTLLWCLVRLAGDKHPRRIQIDINDIINLPPDWAPGVRSTSDRATSVHEFEGGWWFYNLDRSERAGPFDSRESAVENESEFLVENCVDSGVG